MKKAKFITGLSASFVTMMALLSCSTIRSNGDIVLIYNGKSYTAEELFIDQTSTEVGKAEFDAVYKVAVRSWLEGAGNEIQTSVTNKTKNDIAAQKKLAQSNADKNHTSYDTEWELILKSKNCETEQELYNLFEYDEAKDAFTEEFYKDDNMFKTIEMGGNLIKDDEDTKVDGYIPSKHPYHVRHILVKLSQAKENEPLYDTITEEEAVKLHDVITSLAVGEDFGVVAKKYSDDEGSRDKYGDLGIMDTDTSFVNEFKLGTYLFESYFSSSTDDNKDGKDAYQARSAKKGLGLFKKEEDYAESDGAKYYANQLAKEIKDPTNKEDSGGETPTELNGIGVIPYEAADLLQRGDWTKPEGAHYGVADLTYASAEFTKASVNTDNAAFYPRNVIFNKYFNKHNIMVIAPRKITDLNTYTLKGEEEGVDAIGRAKAVVGDPRSTEGISNKRLKDDYYCGVTDNSENGYTKLKGFPTDTGKYKNNDSLNIVLDDDDGNDGAFSPLRDSNGRIIFVFRSGTGSSSSSNADGYQGIHFVTIERSPFIGKEYKTAQETEEEGYKDGVTLDEYYTRYYPTDDKTSSNYKYPRYELEGRYEDKATYSNYVSEETATCKTRSDAVKDKVKNSTPNLDMSIYHYLLKSNSLTFKGDKGEEIRKYIELWEKKSKKATEIKDEESWDSSWKTYYQNLKALNEERKVEKVGEDEYQGGIVSDVAVTIYKDWAENKSSATFGAEALRKLFDKGGLFYHEA